MSDLSY